MVTEWTPPITWSIAQKVRAADLNAQVRDNLLYLFDSPACAVRLTANQSVDHATDHTISWDEMVWDSHGDMTDIAGAPTTITITRSGLYIIDANMLWDESTDAGKRAMHLHVNADTVPRRGLALPAVSPSEGGRTWLTNLAALDSLTFKARQLSGAPLNLRPTRTVVTIAWFRGAP